MTLLAETCVCSPSHAAADEWRLKRLGKSDVVARQRARCALLGLRECRERTGHFRRGGMRSLPPAAPAVAARARGRLLRGGAGCVFEFGECFYVRSRVRSCLFARFAFVTVPYCCAA